MDIFVLPSRWEGMPYALMEAMALGRPVIASDVCGMDDVVQDGKTGLLFEGGNVNSFCRTIRRLVEDRALRKRLGAAARKSAKERFNLSRMLGQMDALYQELAQ